MSSKLCNILPQTTCDYLLIKKLPQSKIQSFEEGSSDSESNSEQTSLNFAIDADPLSSNNYVVDNKTKESDEDAIKEKSVDLKSIKLASSLKPGIVMSDTYITVYPEEMPDDIKTKLKKLSTAFSENNKVLEKCVLNPKFEKEFCAPTYSESIRQKKKARMKEREKTKGSNWFNMAAPEMTEEKKNDLLMLQMRNVLDPKHFYKKNDMKSLPKYFQVGTVIENSIDFYHSRIPKKDRKRTLVEELMADAEFKRYKKRKYSEIMANAPQRIFRHKNKIKKR